MIFHWKYSLHYLVNFRQVYTIFSLQNILGAGQSTSDILSQMSIQGHFVRVAEKRPE